MAYVADSANNDIVGYDVCSSAAGGPTPQIYTLPAGTDPIAVKFDRNSSSTDPRLFVLSSATNKQLLWVDVTSPPGNVISAQTQTFAFAPYEVDDSNGASKIWVSFGGNTVKAFSVNEGASTLTPVLTVATFAQPRGMKLEGSGNDMLLGEAVGDVLALNPATLAVDATLNLGGSPTKLTGPNGPTPNCALAFDLTSNVVNAISVGATPANTTHEIGSYAIGLGTPIVTGTFFPPGTPGSGNLGIGDATALVATTNGGADLFSCDGTSLTFMTTWDTFMAAPAAVVPSQYASNAVSSLIYVTGLDNGVPSLQAFSEFYDHDLGSVNLPSGASPTSVTAGP
jgi:hypothetical protein